MTHSLPRRLALLFMTVVLLAGTTPAFAASNPWDGQDASIKARRQAQIENVQKKRDRLYSQEEREAAAARMEIQKLAVGASGVSASLVPTQGGVPDYFGSANWAFSPPLRKFVDEMPGLGPDNANGLGQYIPVGHPDTITYPGSDYYEIELREFEEQMHSDLPPTTLRGYVQTNMGTDEFGENTIAPDPIHYLGVTIVAQKDRPVRVKFTNALPTGEEGDLFIPVDTTVMGAGVGPLGGEEMYTENRATLHNHGAKTPWISDGTPHQWITPAGENTSYPEGVSVQNVPDMPDPGDGSMTFFYTNQQSARLMFYHDHSWGITRLNVYAGEAAGYIIRDEVEQGLIDDGLLPAEDIPLIVQDKTFVDTSTVLLTDPTWNWGSNPPDENGIVEPKQGDLWYPHVYSPAQNPFDLGGANPFGRWHYGPWFWPPTNGLTHMPIPNPYYDPVNAPWQPPMMPATPNPSMPGEAFMDTPLVNGTAFPYMEVDPKTYRFRVLNAADDRFFNLQMYEADTSTVSADLRTETEVKMIDASVCATFFPETWPTDGREGGVPDPRTAGPDWIQIGTESGFLPAPAVIPAQPIVWNNDPTTFNFGNVSDHSLLVAPAERADVLVDFSAYAGKTLILYNDAPAAFPARDARLDYYTGSPDLTDTGGYWGTEIGFGPNTRTIMQIKVKDTEPAEPYDLAALEAEFVTTDTQDGVFKRGQDPIPVGQTAYDQVYDTTFPSTWPNWGVSNIGSTELSFQTVAGDFLTIPMEPKAIQDEMGEAFDPDYGRMSGRLGLELPNTQAGRQTFVLQNFTDPITEKVQVNFEPMSPVLGDGTQIWKITHNGVDTHPIHFHSFDVQLINRVGWDGAIRLPDANELGFKETVRVSPLEDTIVAFRAVAPKPPFGVPESYRPLDPSQPIGGTMGFTNINPYTGQPLAVPTTNQIVNFKWEYVWHCHILSHEEMDMMRPMSLEATSVLPTAPVLEATGTVGGPIQLNWVDATPWDGTGPLTTLGDMSNEIGFRVERALIGVNGVAGPYTFIGDTLANETTFTDNTTILGGAYRYRVVAFNNAGDSISNVVLVGSGSPIRVFGPDRYATAVDSSFAAFPSWTGVQHVVVASGENNSQVDSLAAAGLAGAYEAPLLLTRANSVPQVTRDAIDAMPDGVQVHVVGGSTAVSNAVQTALGSIPGVASVDRIGGATRYETAANVAFRMESVLGPAFPGSAFIVNGSNSANLWDGLVSGPASWNMNYPVLLVTATSVPAATSNALTTLGLTQRYIVGGPTAVTAAVQTTLGVAAGDRISGADRYKTAVAFANRSKLEGWLNFQNIGVGAATIDALAGGGTMGKMGGPTLLTANASTVSPDLAAFITANKAEISWVWIFGGDAVVPDAQVIAIGNLLE